LSLPEPPPAPELAVMLPPVPAAPAPAVPAAPLALPLLVATLPMFWMLLPDTLPFRFAVALADEVLKLFEKVDVAVPPLFAAVAPMADAVAAPELWLLLFVFVVVLVLWSLLSWVLWSLLSVVVVVTLWSLLSCVLLSCVLLSCVLLLVSVFVTVFVLRLLLSVVVVLVLLLLLSWVLLSVERVVVCVAVLPPRARFESCACALNEKASEIAVTSMVLFIRVPLWV
jgi:hypothetical protein